MLSLVCARVQAVQWTQVSDRSDYRGTFSEQRFVDIDSIVRDSFSGDVRYLIRVISRFGTAPTEILRTVVARCDSRQRFEVVAQSDLSDRPFKTVFKDTTIEAELIFVCERLISQPGSPNVVSEARPNATIQPTPKNESGFTGSGVAVSKSQVISNFHVVENCTQLEVRFGSKITQAKVVAKDPTFDLALISTDHEFPMVPAMRQSASLGEDVMVAGYPLAGLLGTELIVTSGQINSMTGLRNDSRRLQLSAPVQPGNSGGPVIDRFGNIVGIVVSKLNVERVSKAIGDYAQNINFAIKPEVVRLFLSANGIDSATPKPSRKLENQELAQRARGFSVQIICN